MKATIEDIFANHRNELIYFLQEKGQGIYDEVILEESIKEEINIEKDVEYHSWNDPYYNSKYWSGPHTSNNNTYDPINDPMSPYCPWGYYSM